MKFPDIGKPLPEPLEMMAQKIAKATHEFWMLDMTRQGWRPALETKQETKEHAWLIGWHRLPKEVQQQYISQARAIPWIIYRSGMELIFTASATLTLLKDLIKSQRGKHGIKQKQSGRSTTAARPRPGRGKAVQQKKQSTPGGDSQDSGSGPTEDPINKSGGRGGSDGESSEASPGESSTS